MLFYAIRPHVADFIGEPIEDTVRREIAEEVGLDVASIKYAGVSQPWPFPQMSLMCGFYAIVNGLPEVCNFSFIFL